MIQLPYIFVFYILILLSVSEYPNKTFSYYDKSVKIFLLFLMFFVLILFIGFRGYIGNDWINYKYFYDRIPQGFNITDIQTIQQDQVYEAGWNYFASICRYLGFSYISFQCLNFFIDIFLLILIVRRYAKQYVVLFFCLFLPLQGYTFSLIILRNTKAIYIFILSLKYIKNRHFFKFLFCCLLGYLFHKSVIIFLPLYFFLHKKCSSKVLLVLFLFGNSIFLLQLQWLKVILNIVINMLPENSLTLLTKAYLFSDVYNRSFGITIGYIERFFTFCFFYKHLDVLYGDNDDFIVEVNCYFIFISVFLFFTELYIVIERIPNYFIFVYWIFYPRLFRRMDNITKFLFYVSLFFYGSLRIWITVDAPCYYYENILTGISSASDRIFNYSGVE